MKPRYERVPVEWQQIDTDFNPGEIPNLVDGDETTGWQAGGPPNRPQRIEVNLKESHRIALVVLTVPDDGVEAASRLRVQASADGRNYFNARRFVLPESEPGNTGRFRVHVVLDAREARFLRFLEPRDELGEHGGLSLSEIELYENDSR